MLDITAHVAPAALLPVVWSHLVGCCRTQSPIVSIYLLGRVYMAAGCLLSSSVVLSSAEI